jgi:DNA polymerase/3'-5' exonuclease PolX
VSYELAIATRRAEAVVDMLRDGCEHVEIAGSIRRGALTVKDIEVVAIPKHQPDLFGGDGFDLLNETLRLRVREGRLLWRGSKGGTSTSTPDIAGRRFYSLADVGGVPIDLFAVRPPAQWGAILAIRTGPAEYAKALVTRARSRGLKCEDGRLVSLTTGIERPTPTEQEFIEACGHRYLPPGQRR